MLEHGLQFGRPGALGQAVAIGAQHHRQAGLLGKGTATQQHLQPGVAAGTPRRTHGGGQFRQALLAPEAVAQRQVQHIDRAGLHRAQQFVGVLRKQALHMPALMVQRHGGEGHPEQMLLARQRGHQHRAVDRRVRRFAGGHAPKQPLHARQRDQHVGGLQLVAHPAVAQCGGQGPEQHEVHRAQRRLHQRQLFGQRAPGALVVGNAVGQQPGQPGQALAQ